MTVEQGDVLANLRNPALFFTTSPRSPEKMIPEIRLLCEEFSGLEWDKSAQIAFTKKLAASEFFAGSGSPKDNAFSARDRITRAPKALGFVELKPAIQITEAGRQFVYGKRPQESLLRQLLKFQLPSPFHREGDSVSGVFCVRPYLEIMRLIFELDKLSFDEFKIFALGLTDYHRYEAVKEAIRGFRKEKEAHKGRYKEFVDTQWTLAVERIYGKVIADGKTRTRESKDASLEEFIRTKKSNMRDYADACFRYLRFTGLFSYQRRSIIVSPDKRAEVAYILDSVDRNPVFVDDEKAYTRHLFDATLPALYTDNRENLVASITNLQSHSPEALSGLDIEQLKDIRDNAIQQKLAAIICDQEKQLKSYALYQEVVDMFGDIVKGQFVDAPLHLEWNTWRALTMLDGGAVKGNFKIDDAGQPMATAPGNMPDIECDYGDFVLSVEVTLQKGQRQYETEGEPVTRHYAQLRKRSAKETYCLFIAPNINQSTLAHFFIVNKTDTEYYGGTPKIIPLELEQFIRLVDKANSHSSRPQAADIWTLLHSMMAQAGSAANENDWMRGIRACVDSWLVA